MVQQRQGTGSYKVPKADNNILLVANYKSDVGYAWWLMENFWAEIAMNFARYNQKCILIYPEINAVPEIIKQAPIQLVKHDFADRSPKALINLIKIIKKHRIKNIYLTDKAYFDWLYLVFRAVGVDKIINHDHMPGERTQPKIYKKFIKKTIHSLKLLSCDHYIGVSRFVKDRAVDIACVPVDKCSFVHNGIKLFNNTKSDYAHEVFGIPKSSRVIVTTGRATFYKGIDKLIACANILINEKGIDDVWFLHVGDGPDLETFKKMAVDLGLKERFIFAGFRQDIHDILPSCDIGVQVSLGEAFSLSVIEYLHAGLATLAPNNCGNSEAIKDGVNGLLFSPGNISEIVGKIQFLLNNRSDVEKMKEAARTSVLENFRIQECNRKLMSLLDRQFV